MAVLGVEPLVLVGGAVGALVAGALLGTLVGRTVGPAAIPRAIALCTVAALPLLWFGWWGALPSLLLAYLGSAALTLWSLRRAVTGTLEAVPPAAAPADVWVHANVLQARGFRVVTALRFAPRGLREQFLLELVDPARACFAQVNAIVGAPRQSVVLLSAYPAGSLRTTSSPAAMANPGELVHALPGASVDDLLAAHGAARATLAGLGFEPLPAEPAQAEPYARARVAAEADVVRRMGLLDVLALARRSRAHRADLTAQPATEAVLAGWRSGGADPGISVAWPTGPPPG